MDLETPDNIALLAGEYGNGRLVFNTGNFSLFAYDPGSDKYLVQMTDWAGNGKKWSRAYSTLFDSSSDLELFREYRDAFLSKTSQGEHYTIMLYRSSEEALEVLLDNPELMLEARLASRLREMLFRRFSTAAKGSFITQMRLSPS